MHYKTDGTNAIEPRSMEVGEQVKLAGDQHWWTVRAVSEHFAALARLTTQQDYDDAEWRADPDDEHWENPYEPGRMLYTVLDWRNGVRGPCNLIGQGYGDGTYSENECAEMLAMFESGDLEVSHRNWVRIEFAEVSA